jgi:predicted carbohydrate-binding protein with CBM5 and CBM33 domain
MTATFTGAKDRRGEPIFRHIQGNLKLGKEKIVFRKSLYKILVFLAVSAALAVSIGLVLAHGSMADPISRVYECYLQDPESPDTVVCSDVIESSGTQPLYDWNEINISNAGGNHQAIIPDGQLCSAGREKYAAFDEPRTDWPRTIMPDSGPYTFLYSAYVPHNQGYFELWVTKDGYDPTQPLTWADIEQFAVVNEPPVVNGYYEMTVDLPEGKSGHHVIYSIWQRNDSQEAFYACSDVWFGTDPTPTPTTAPACTEPAWNNATTYSAGDVVSHNNAVWRANWGSSGIAPSGSAPAWRIRAYCSSDGSVTPIPPTATSMPPTDVPPTDIPPTATDTPDEPTNTPVPPTATQPPVGGVCEVDYVVSNSWSNVFQANVTITNNDETAVSGWTLNFTHADGQTATGGWNADISQSGNDVTVSNPASYWNGTIPANGGSVTFGLQGTFSGSVVIPTDFTVNGTACNQGNTPTATPIPPTATTVPPTATNIPPTATSVPPTATLIPEITPTFTATPTDVPPTATATAVPPTATPGPGGSCSVAYDFVNQWGTGFQANITITNHDETAVSGYTLEWDFPGNEDFQSGWNATYSESGSAMTASNPAGHWNGTIGANGGSVSFGFIAYHTGSYGIPGIFTLNGEVCD